MRLLLYDEDPDSHQVDKAVLELLGLEWADPQLGPPRLVGHDALAVHVGDDARFHHNLAENAVAANVPTVLYSGEYEIAAGVERRLRTNHPMAWLCAVPVEELHHCLYSALKANDIGLLCWDRLSDVLEILTSLWAIGLTWEIEGHPRVVTCASGGLDLQGRAAQKDSTLDLLDSEGKLNLEELGRTGTAAGKTLVELSENIYARSDVPDTDFGVLAVGTPEEYRSGLIALRDSLLNWVGR
jgi:hypothetical protein